MSNGVKDYLNISQGKDLKNPKEKILYRFLEITPGFLSWGTLISALIISFLAPVVVAIFIILFDFYWLLKVGYLALHQISSFLQMKKNLKTNWLERVKQFSDWQKIYHLIILPFYKEEKEIVESSCQALVETKYPKDKMIVVLTTEERAGPESQKVAKMIKRKFSKKFSKFLVTIHPKNLPCEIAGRGSNTHWAIKIAEEKIIKPLKIPEKNVIVSTFDIDTRPYPQYFSCLTFNYLNNNNQKASYQPIPVYNNNVWLAPAFSRVISTSGTFWQMMQQERPENLVTYSSHSTPLKVIRKIGYPDNVVSDDSRIFWKALLFYDGDYKVVPLYYPISMDAVLSKNLLRTVINQYRQQRRWAWGCNDIPFLLFGFLKNKKISLSQKLRHSLNILEGFWSWATASLLIFFLGWLPLILGQEKFNVTLLFYNLPRLTQNLMIIAMIGMLTSCIISFLILPPKPKNFNQFKNISLIFQWLLLPFTLIFFGAFPALEAQTRLMLGKYLGFWPTEKVRIPKSEILNSKQFGI